MQHRVVFLAAALGALAPLSAQLPLQLRSSFPDPQSGGAGSSGVARDELVGNSYVLDSSNQQTVHEFDGQGSLLSQFGLTNCNPPAPTPVGISYDAAADSLWILDGNLSGPGLTNAVIEVSRTGACRSGWTFLPPALNPEGIAFKSQDSTLWIAGSGAVSQWDRQGTRLRGGFGFVTPSGNRRLRGISHLAQPDHFAIVADRDPLVYEVDRTGSVVSVADLSPFGVVDPQGIHFSPSTATLSVVDGAQSMVYVFDVSACAGTVTRFGVGCPDFTGTPLSLGVSGCPTIGSSLSFAVVTGAGNTLGVWLAAGFGKTALPNGTPLPLNLGAFGAPGCVLLIAPDVTAGPIPNPGGGATFVVPVPNNPALPGLGTHWQGFQLPIVTSDALTVRIG